MLWRIPIRSQNLWVKIVVAFSLLLILVQLAGLVTINTALFKSANREIEQKLVAGQRIFDLLHKENGRQLAQAARILSSDFAFRQAAATGDRPTVISALLNQGARINADVMMLSGLNNILIADTLHLENAGGEFPFADLISIAEQDGQITLIVLIDNQPYDMVLVPVLAPVPIAWLAMGFKIDNNFAQRLQSLTSLEVSFVDREGPAGIWKLLATTVPTDERTALTEALSRDNVSVTGDAPLHLTYGDYVTSVSVLSARRNHVIAAVLQKSLRAELESLVSLQRTLLLLGIISLIATFAASVLIARNVTRPLSALGKVAQNIEKGDYSQPVVIDREDEIGRLAFAFDHMRQGIAAREATIVDLAFRDTLTKLPNRTLFHDRLLQAIKNSQRTDQTPTVLILDLDRFKEVNDTMGHHVGDLLLQEIATRFQVPLLRESDTVARLGGDEFGILLPFDDCESAETIARKIIVAVEQPVMLGGQRVVIGASIGIASFPEHGEDMHTLLRHADVAMYIAKRNNSGFAIYDPRYDEKDQNRLSLMSELRRAVEHDELTLYYQPKVDMTDGVVNKVEALVRWMHPERGLIPPDQFIPFAEHTGYIKAVTRWVLDHALRQSVHWRELGLMLNISINLSTRDLLNPELPGTFTDLMSQHKVSSEWLSLEITESAIMTDPEHAQGVLEFLRGIGLKISVDDFGTGYSSLRYLKTLPVCELKIDKSFVMNMAKDRGDASIVRSTIDLGHNMGLKVVAEGVEDRETWDLLRSWGCDMAQGYFVSAPLPPEKLVRWLPQSHWQPGNAANA